MRKKVVILFQGQGSQRPGMCEDLLKTSKARHLDTLFREVNGFSIIQFLKEAASDELNKTTITQPLMFFLGLLSYEVLTEESEVYVAGAGGHSLGEITALTAAGVFSYEDGFFLVNQRARFMDMACKKELTGMVAVIGDRPEKLSNIASKYGVYTANFNSETQVVFGGNLDSLNRFREEVTRYGYRTVFLRVQGAFHTPYMEEATSQFHLLLSKMKLNPPSFPVVSNVDGQIHDYKQIKEKLARQISSPVRWKDCVKTLQSFEPDYWIETCPGNLLIKLLPDSVPGKRLSVSSINDVVKVRTDE